MCSLQEKQENYLFIYLFNSPAPTEKQGKYTGMLYVIFVMKKKTHFRTV